MDHKNKNYRVNKLKVANKKYQWNASPFFADMRYRLILQYKFKTNQSSKAKGSA